MASKAQKEDLLKVSEDDHISKLYFVTNAWFSHIILYIYIYIYTCISYANFTNTYTKITVEAENIVQLEENSVNINVEEMKDTCNIWGTEKRESHRPEMSCDSNVHANSES